MPRVAETRALPISLRDGFDYITNVANWRTYWPHLLDIPEQDRTSWAKPGDTARVVLEIRSRPVELKMELEQFEPYSLVTYSSTQEGLPPFHHERHFREKDGSLDYTLVISFQPRSGLSAIVDRLFVARTVRGSLVETLDNLERIFRDRPP
ncbi:MAG: hypothetical protein E6G60_22325 [Actinobacteria bacterium]|nr:MAG: hypothetical protein E6G60_22325 [Actinomycetota bacterium]